MYNRCMYVRNCVIGRFPSLAYCVVNVLYKYLNVETSIFNDKVTCFGALFELYLMFNLLSHFVWFIAVFRVYFACTK